MQAIVLSRQDFKEYDQIVSLYTREEGRRDLLARGIKKIVSKNAAHLEPCSFVEVGIAHGKDMDIITNVQIEEYFPAMRKNYYKSLLGLWAAQTMKIFFTSPERDERVFRLFSSWLHFVDVEKEISPYLLDALVMRSLGYLGFTPILDVCVECERPRAGKVFFFSLARGGIMCSDCRSKKSLPQETWFRLTLEFLEAFQVLFDSPWEKLSTLNQEKKFVLRVHHFVFLFLQYHHQTPVKDWLKIAKLSDFSL